MQALQSKHFHGWRDWKSVQLLWKTIGGPSKLKVELPFPPAIPLLGMYPKELKTGSQKDTCTPMFIAALFTIAKTWEQPKCPLTDISDIFLDYLDFWFLLNFVPKVSVLFASH